MSDVSSQPPGPNWLLVACSLLWLAAICVLIAALIALSASEPDYRGLLLVVPPVLLLGGWFQHAGVFRRHAAAAHDAGQFFVCAIILAVFLGGTLAVCALLLDETPLAARSLAAILAIVCWAAVLASLDFRWSAALRQAAHQADPRAAQQFSLREILLLVTLVSVVGALATTFHGIWRERADAELQGFDPR